MKYEEYKDSGIEWIGEMPSHWMVMPIKRTGSFENGLTYSPTDICDENGVLVLRSSNIQNDKLSFEDNVYVAKCPLSLMVKSGDIIICSRNGSASLVGKCAMVEGNVNATYGAFMMRYRPICKSNKVFSYYLLQTALKCYKGLYSTTTINQLTKGVIGQIYVSYPPFHEQQAIATYLDEKCGEINRAIDVQKKKIDILNELKQTIITDAVTKGLDPNAPMKDSGVEWIGEMPEHWALVRIKDICKIYGRIGYRGYTEKDLVSEGEGAITLSPSNLQGGKMNYSKCSYLAWKKYYESPEIMIFNNDIIFVKTGSTYGKCAIVENLPMEATINPQSIVFKNIKCNAAFLNYVLFSDVIQIQIENSVVGGTIPTIAQDKINNYKFVLPLLPEQQEIVAYLDDQLLNVDAQITKANRRIELLEELKQSIITEAVTGKIKVC